VNEWKWRQLTEDSDTKNHPWKEWYAWYPVKDIYGKWHWREPMFRKVGNTYVDHDDWTWYYYITSRDLTLFLLRWP